MSFDLRNLRYVIAAAEHGSFFRAALALEIEQSTMSRNIVRHEKRLGVKLFRRLHGCVLPTAAGAEFIRSARQLLAKADQLTEVMRSAGEGKTGRLTVGYSSPVPAGHLRATLLAWRDQSPDVELDRIEAQREALVAGLDAGVIDVAIMGGEMSYIRMQHAVFWNETVCVGLPASHPLAALDTVGWSDLSDETFLLAADVDSVAHCIGRSGIAPTIRTVQQSAQSVLSMLSAEGGVTLTCESSASGDYPDVVLRPVNDGETGVSRVPFSGYWRKDNDNPALRQFLAFVRSHGPDIRAIN
jgi:DNA-binding transcriptional LysR family regulator